MAVILFRKTLFVTQTLISVASRFKVFSVNKKVNKHEFRKFVGLGFGQVWHACMQLGQLGHFVHARRFILFAAVF